MGTGPGEDDPDRDADSTERGDPHRDGTPATEPSAGEDDEREWRFSVDDFPDPGDAQATGDGTETSGSNVTGTLKRRQPLEPGEIDPENAFFVVVGVLIVVGLVVGALLGF